MSENSKLICFDYDGVIADSLEFVLRSVNSVLEDMNLTSRVSPAHLQKMQNVTFPQIGLDAGVLKKDIGEFIERLFLLLEQGRKNVKLFAGMPEVIAALAANHTLAVVSASPAEAIRLALEAAGIAHHFSALAGAEEPGDKTVKINSIRAGLAYAGEETWMIGDSVSDIRAGRLADASTIAVSWGWQTAEFLQSERPDFLAETPKRLEQILNCVET